MGNFSFAVWHLLLILFIQIVVAPPPNRQSIPETNAQQQEQQKSNQELPNHPDQPTPPNYKFTYSKYLELVVGILESEPKFQERIKNMNQEDIKAGKIADHIDDLDPTIFDKLTKAKIEEIDRLREEIKKQMELDGDAKNIAMPEHLDITDFEKFGKEDLRKLITKTVSEMNKIDEERRKQFKEYEMRKKAEEDHRLAQMSEDERKRVIAEDEAAKKRHSEHEALKHPGGREQLEEVWEERDKMEKESYDPKTFFALHDLNGDGQWSEEELEALFQIELEKVYNETNPDDDPNERVEEMYRMREHVVAQMDKNKDRMISLDEFLQDTEAQENDDKIKDPGWEDLSKEKIYTDEELKKFEEEYARKKQWGEHPYETVTPQQEHQQQQQQNNNNFNQQQQQNNNNFNQQQQQPQIVHPEIAKQAEINQPSQQPSDVPIKIPKAVDPVYGI